MHCCFEQAWKFGVRRQVLYIQYLYQLLTSLQAGKISLRKTNNTVLKYAIKEVVIVVMEYRAILL
jgi:hypothetical protein